MYSQRPSHCAFAGFVILLLVAPASIGCSEVGSDAVGTQDRPVFGGTETDEFPAVLELEFDGRHCTGVVIGERTVITAAHCLSRLPDPEAIRRGRALFGARTSGEGANPERSIAVLDARYHRYYGIDTVVAYDIGLVLLAEPVGVAPMAFNSQPLEGTLQGSSELIIVGYGYNTAVETGGGVKRVGSVRLGELFPRHLYYRPQSVTICDGDSGGPHLLDIAGTPTIVGISSIGFCADETAATRLDPYSTEFLFPTIDSWEGPCKRDGICTTEGCRTPDPDCGPCGLDGECAAGCMPRDLDCPLMGTFLDSCRSDADCESRLCVSQRAAGVRRYCSLPCSNLPASGVCTRGTRCGVDPRIKRTENVCLLPTPPALADDEPCTSDGECASGACHPLRNICVPQCTDASACADAEVCEPHGNQQICLPGSDGGGWCSTTGDNNAPSILAVALAWLVLRQRRVS